MRLQQSSKNKISPSEHAIQSAFFSQIHIDPFFKPYRGLIFAIPNAARRSYALAAYMRAEGLTPGVWDVLVCVPSANSHALWIEFKTGYNKLTDHQIAFRDALLPYNYEFLVCYSCEQAIIGIKTYLGDKT